MVNRLARSHTGSDLVGTRGRAALQAAGWTAVAFGGVHAVVAPFQARETWSRVASEGWWDRFTLDEPSTPAEFERSHGFWVSVGSFGVPMLALGSYLLWSVRHGHRVPGWLGSLLLAWGVPLVIVLPRSPGWAIPVIGGLIVLGDRRNRLDTRAATAG